MSWLQFLQRNLGFFWRTNLAVVAGFATAVAVLAGALLVGQSVRGSLRDLVLERLGELDYLILSNQVFPQDLADRIASHSEFRAKFRASCPILFAQGILIHEKSGQRARSVNVYGIDERFWQLQRRPHLPTPTDRESLLGEALARELGARSGDSLLLRIEKQGGIPKESLFGRREDTGRTIRLVCRDILSPQNLGELSLRPTQGSVLSIFVPLARLQRDLEQKEGANVVLFAASDSGDSVEFLRKALKERFDLQDLGLTVKAVEKYDAIVVESRSVILQDAAAQPVIETGRELGFKESAVFTYLANALRLNGRSIPYSVVAAGDLGRGALGNVRLIEGSTQAPDATPAIWLNDWAHRDLGARIGDTLFADYYTWREEGRLDTQTTSFKLAGVIALEGDAADTTLAPDFPGITEADNIGDWDPPFPVELQRIRPKDEDYWDQHRATPKAFVTLSRGQELWQTRFGRLTSIRLRPGAGKSLEASRRAFVSALQARLDPERFGLTLESVKQTGLDAAGGSTDFGEYFLYFSFFLIVSAILLAALFFRLGVEQRVREIGVLRSLGFSDSAIHKLFLSEGALLSVAGAAVGVLASLAYAGLLLFGLRTWWVDAVGTRRLELHLSPGTVALGALAGVVAALLSTAIALGALRHLTARALMAGEIEHQAVRSQRSRKYLLYAGVSLLLALGLTAAAWLGGIAQPVAFFAAGTLFLVSLLSLISALFRARATGLLAGSGWNTILRFGNRNAGYRPGRSTLCVSLIASATFVIISVEAFRHDSRSVSLDRMSGTGGFPLYAEAALPVIHDLNSPDGREALNLPAPPAGELSGTRFVPFRLRPGDDASCLNLYKPQEPRILGASASFVAERRFLFHDSLARTAAEQQNPWLLLESSTSDGAVPAIGDANTIQYILHRKLGDELVVSKADGEPVRLRLVAALRDSLFQGELIISERRLLEAFPEQEGYRFFLIDTPPARMDQIVGLLEEQLSDFGLDVSSTAERVALFHRVENTYLSTFQSLGGLGLVLGTIGLGTVLLRNVLERRRELALLRAVGFGRGVLGGIVFAENLVLLILGLASGTVCALVAVAPALIERSGGLSWGRISVTLAAVACVGLASSLLALRAAFRSPLLPALRSE